MNNTDRRGPGAPAGRRPVVWVCSAIVGQKLVTEKFLVKDQSPGKDTDGSFPKAIAEDDFAKKHGINPTVVLGPFFDDKRGYQSEKMKKKRLSVDRDNLDKYKIDVKRRSAIFGDWKGFCNAIEDNSELVFFMFMSEVNPSDKKRNLPAPGIVSISDLTYVEDLAE